MNAQLQDQGFGLPSSNWYGPDDCWYGLLKTKDTKGSALLKI
jgi:hypothetical protein